MVIWGHNGEKEGIMETAEMKFHEITLEDKEWMDARFAEDDRNACEYSFANNFVWRKVYHVEVAEYAGCLVIRFWDNGQKIYSFPVGDGDKKAALQQLLDIEHADGRKLLMSPLVAEDRKQLLEWFPGRFLIEGNRDDYDYIYSREKLSTLAGKKLHGKRNHIARFKDGDDWSYEPMDEKNIEECRNMTYTWVGMRSEKWNPEMEQEVMVLHEAFDHMKELGLVGGVLRKKGEIVAFTIGEPLNSDTFVAHFEKAFPDMQGAYPMINQQFVLNACQDYAYVNREEDTGDMGLRKAKLSYYPDILLKKYIAEESRIVYADRERDGEAIIKLWKTCFGDEESYIRYYLDHRMTEENMLVIFEDGVPVSMASFLPVEYYCGGEYVPARYVYATATLPEYRGRGFAGQILKFAGERYNQPLILSPGEESLVKYYEGLGFRRAFPEIKKELDAGVQAMEVKADEGHGLDDAEPVTAEEYAQIRDERQEREGYVRWDAKAIAYAMGAAAYEGGKTVAIAPKQDEAGTRDIQGTGEKRDILMYGRQGDVLEIIETTLSESRLLKILPELLNEMGAKRASVGQKAGMLWLPDSMKDVPWTADGYLNLTLG